MTFTVVLAALAVISSVDCVNARIYKMNFVTRCGCANKVSKERDDAYKKFNVAIGISENIITINNCPTGQEFKYDNYDIDTNDYKIECVKCPENYYRTAKNTSCLRCPVGFYSQEGDTECIKAKTNTSNLHTLCKKGHIVGNDKYAKYEDSCFDCNPEKKEYMPYDNNHDECFKCPVGSIVDIKGRKCTECPIGYYEKNNKCVECEIGKYADQRGSAECKVCNNEYALAHSSLGAYSCENSIFYELTEGIKKNLVNLDILLKPLAYSANIGVAMISNNRREVEFIIPFIGVAYLMSLI